MKRPSLLFLTVALLLSVACKSESPNAPAASPAAANATPSLPPGAVEVNTSTLKKDADENPQDVTARYNLGTAYLVEGKYLEAAEAFKFVAEQKPDDADALAKM